MSTPSLRNMCINAPESAAPMDEFNEEVLSLVQACCGYAAGSKERKHYLEQLIRLLQASGKLCRDPRIPENDYESEVLQPAWIYLCRNLCHPPETAKEAYNPERSKLTTWLNAYIKFRTLSYWLEIGKQNKEIAQPFTDSDGNIIDPIDLIPAPLDIPPIVEELHDWIETHSSELLRCHVRHRPEVSCKMLLLHRLPPQLTPWSVLAQNLEISEDTLRGFYRRKCLPKLREAGQELGCL
jgi:hypothetical protein